MRQVYDPLLSHFQVVREQETDSFIREDGREIIEAINGEGLPLIYQGPIVSTL